MNEISLPAKLQGKIPEPLKPILRQIWEIRPSLSGNQSATVNAALEALARETGILPQLSYATPAPAPAASLLSVADPIPAPLSQQTEKAETASAPPVDEFPELASGEEEF